MARPEHLELAQRLITGLDGGAERLSPLLRPDVVGEYPQSGERVRGRDTVALVLAGDPSVQDGAVVAGLPRVTSLGPSALALEAPLQRRVAGEASPTWSIVRLELEGTGIARVVTFVAEPFEALAYRAEWVTRFDPLREAPDHSEPPPGGGVDRDTVLRWTGPLTGGHVADSGALFHDAWIGDYPQSGERFVGFEALRKAHDPYPGGLPIERVRGISGVEDAWAVGPLMPVRVHGDGACWMMEIQNDYPDGSRLMQVIVFRLEERRIHRMRTWWCAPFDPPPWRAAHAERYDAFEGVG
jgi:hypothetical protein